MSYSQHIYDQMPRKNELNISIAVLHISGILIYFDLKKQFLKNYQKEVLTLQWYLDIFSQIAFNPLKLRTSQQLSFCADQWWKISCCHKFLNIFQDDFSCALLLQGVPRNMTIARRLESRLWYLNLFGTFSLLSTLTTMILETIIT